MTTSHREMLPSTLTTRRVGITMIITGIIAFLSAFELTIERFRLAADPGFVPSCSINPVLSCSPVMSSWQAALFGFPNPLLGIAGFAIIVTLGVLLASNIRLPRWVGIGLQLGVTFALGFVIWLMSQSLYDIGALCLYCMVVWAMTIPLFINVTLYNIQERVIFARFARIPERIVEMMVDYRVLGTIIGYAVVVGLIGIRFWDFWSTLI